MPNAPKKPGARKPHVVSKKKSPVKRKVNRPADDGFPAAFAELLRKRKISVPSGLESAPPEAHSHQPVSFVDQLAKQSDAQLKALAERIAGHTTRQRARAKVNWDSSPLIRELRRRKLKEPKTPERVVGASVSLRKPLKEWSDAQLLKAANEWAKKGS